MRYPWAVWNNKTIELEIPDHPGDHLRRLDAWLQHEKLKVTGYAAPALEYLAYVPWKKMQEVDAKKSLSFFGSASHTLPQAGEDQTT